MNAMALDSGSSPSKILSDIHGVKLLPGRASSEDEYLVDKTIRRDFNSRRRSRGRPGTEASALKPQLSPWQAIWHNRPSWSNLLDQESKGDRSVLETAANVATSLPFLAIGIQTPRTRPAATVFANSLIGVSVASSLYHVSRGQTRKLLRLGDYIMIAVSSASLNIATRREPSTALLVATALLLPVQPMAVSCFHTGMMEATFARRAARDPSLRKAHSLHTLSTFLGGVLFIADDVLPHTPFIHAAWHMAAAVGIATCTKLLKLD